MVEIAKFIDKYGDERIIHRDKNGLKVKRKQLTPAIKMNQAIAKIIGEKIKTERIAQGLTLEELCIRAGISSVTPKERMWEIENSIRNQGIRLGTLYAIAIALGCEPIKFMPTTKEVLLLANVHKVKLTSLG